MGIWYEVERTKKGIENFLECNWEFHDFRVEKIMYVPGKDMVEIFLKYDTGREGVLLRFAWIKDMHINTQCDFDAAWISGSSLLLLENDVLIWMDEEFEETDMEECRRYATWVEAERLFWAVTDEEGNPVELPEDRVNQVWNTNGKEEEKHFELKEFTDKWDNILKPYYERK